MKLRWVGKDLIGIGNMSMFTKRRLVIRKKQEADRKRWEEGLKESNRSMNDILKTTKIIEEKHPEFESLEGEERVKIFAQIYNEVHKQSTIEK